VSDEVFKMLELVGTSPTSVEDAVNNALSRASQTLRDLKWFEVLETRGAIKGGRVSQWQVTIKVGFKLEGG
jgi:hypothetical protein